MSAHKWTDRSGRKWQIWPDGKVWRDNAQVRVPRPVADELYRMAAGSERLLRAVGDDGFHLVAEDVEGKNWFAARDDLLGGEGAG